VPDQPAHPTLNPGRTALLVMDYQSWVVARLPDTDMLLERVSSAIERLRGRGGHIGWVRVAFTDSDFDSIPETSIFAAMTAGDRRRALHIDAPSAAIHPKLTPGPDDIMVRKTRVGAFSTTDLDQQLRAREVTTLVLAGLSTSGVVLSTVREAMDRDYQIVVLRDACGDSDLDTHHFLTDKLFPHHTHVTTVSDLDTLFG
jgi:nicotinamidase-related amidase